ncbi:MAG: hypothetical protein ACRD0C_14930 [Acidimicrobiia bacterium]
MKRAFAVAALALAVSVLPGLAGATLDLSLQDPPGAPNVGSVLCLPATPGGQLTCPAPDPVAAVPEAVTPAPASAPPAVATVDDAAYGARLHAELCAARPVFCEVDQSGKYIGAR